MTESLFSRLASYSQNHKKRSVENFTTELLAYLINKDPTFRQIFIKSIVPAEKMRRSFRKASATTQRHYGNGIVDLELENSRGKKVLVEIKIGGEETETYIRGQGWTPQVKKYIDYQQGPVAYLTTRDVPAPNVGKNARGFLGQYNFEDIYQCLDKKNKKKLTENSKLFLEFMGEKNMKPPEPFTRKDLMLAKDAFSFAKKCTSTLDEVRAKITPEFNEMFRSKTSFTAASFSASFGSAYIYTKEYRRGPIKYVEFELEPDSGTLWFSTYINIIQTRDGRAQQLEQQLLGHKWHKYENGRWLGSFISLSGDDRDSDRMVKHAIKNLHQLRKAIQRAGI